MNQTTKYRIKNQKYGTVLVNGLDLQKIKKASWFCSRYQ